MLFWALVLAPLAIRPVELTQPEGAVSIWTVMMSPLAMDSIRRLSPLVAAWIPAFRPLWRPGLPPEATVVGAAPGTDEASLAALFSGLARRRRHGWLPVLR